MTVEWGRYAEAYKAIHDKIAEVLAKLDAPADPQTVEIIASIVLETDVIDNWSRRLGKVGLLVGDIDIDPRDINRKGTPTSFNLTASGNIIAPASGKKLELYGFTLLVLNDEQARLRWGSATGSIIAGLPTKGFAAMNLIGVDEKGGTDQPLYLEKTGAGNVQGRVWTEEVT